MVVLVRVGSFQIGFLAPCVAIADKDVGGTGIFDRVVPLKSIDALGITTFTRGTDNDRPAGDCNRISVVGSVLVLEALR